MAHGQSLTSAFMGRGGGKELTVDKRQEVVRFLLAKSRDGVLVRGSMAKASAFFKLHRNTVSFIWKNRADLSVKKRKGGKEKEAHPRRCRGKDGPSRAAPTTDTPCYWCQHQRVNHDTVADGQGRRYPPLHISYQAAPNGRAHEEAAELCDAFCRTWYVK